MTTANEEIKRLVLTHLLDTYPAGTPLSDKQWAVAYKLIRANMIYETLEWKLDHLTVAY